MEFIPYDLLHKEGKRMSWAYFTESMVPMLSDKNIKEMNQNYANKFEMSRVLNALRTKHPSDFYLAA